jgi:DNA-binding transcriptional LysR family regulator
MRVLRDELAKIDVTISSHSLSHELGDALMRGKLDVAFLRAEMKAAGLIYRVVAKEPLVVILPSDPRFRKAFVGANLTHAPPYEYELTLPDNKTLSAMTPALE